MTSQRLLAGPGWSLPRALPGAVRDEADCVQGGCREEISELPVVPATTGTTTGTGLRRLSVLVQIEAVGERAQIRKMALLLRTPGYLLKTFKDFCRF